MMKCPRKPLIIFSVLFNGFAIFITVKELSEENKQLEQGMKEILQAIKEMQKDSSMKGGETALIIPSLDRLVHVSLLSKLFSFIGFTGLKGHAFC